MHFAPYFVLSVLYITISFPPSLPLSLSLSTDPQSQGQLRLQKLKEWKAKREAAKEKESALKKKPFSCGGGRPTNMNTVTIATDKSTASVAKPALISESNSTAEKCTKNKSKKPTTSNVTMTTNLPPKSMATTGKVDTGKISTNRKAPQSSNAGSRVSKRIVTRQSQETSSKPDARQSSPVSKKTRKASSQPTDRPIRITRSKAANNNITNHSTADEKVVASGKKRVSTNLGKASLKNTGVSGKKRVKSENSGTSASGNKKVKSNMGVALASGKKGVKRASTPPVNAKLTYAECSSDSTDTQSTQTPPRKMSSHINTPYPQTQTGPNSIPDCAWVPNQHVFAPVSSFQTADEVFGTTTFSPFKFTAGESGGVRGSKRKATPRKPFVFNFRQILDHYGNDEVPLPLQAEAVDHVMQTTDGVTEPVDHVIQKTDHVTEPVDHVIHSDVTTDTISVDSLDCTLSSTVSTTPQITIATNTATHIVDIQNFVALETENCAITTATAQLAPTDGSIEEEETVNTIETVNAERQEKTVFKPVSGDGVGVNAWCGGGVSVLYSHHGEIQEEEETGNDITGKSNCKKLAPLIFYRNIFYTCAHTYSPRATS